MAALVGAVEAGFAARARGECSVPLRRALPGLAGTVQVMPPCAIPAQRAVGTDVISLCLGNAARGLPTVLAASLLTDSETGATLAVLEGSTLRGRRTDAAWGVARQRPVRHAAGTLGCSGAGVQVGFPLRGTCAVRPIRVAVVDGRRRERPIAFAEAMTGRLQIPRSGPLRSGGGGGRGRRRGDGETATTPVFEGRLLRPGARVNAIGWVTPTMRELDAETVCRVRVVVGTRDGVLAEAGDLL